MQLLLGKYWNCSRFASPHIKALSGDELKKGTKNNITLSNTPTLVDGGKYTLTLRATDLAGNVGMP